MPTLACRHEVPLLQCLQCSAYCLFEDNSGNMHRYHKHLIIKSSDNPCSSYGRGKLCL